MKNNEAVINTRETASLAKLSFSEEELSSFEEDMSAIVRFAERISAAGPHTGSAATLTNVLRDDCRGECPERDGLLSCAPKDTVKDGCFTVPRVVE